MPNLHAVTLSEQITELKRELAMRETNYRKWIEGGTLDPIRASGQVERMRATLHLLIELDRRINGEEADLFRPATMPVHPMRFIDELGRRRDELGIG